MYIGLEAQLEVFARSYLRVGLAVPCELPLFSPDQLAARSFYRAQLGFSIGMAFGSESLATVPYNEVLKVS